MMIEVKIRCLYLKAHVRKKVGEGRYKLQLLSVYGRPQVKLDSASGLGPLVNVEGNSSSPKRLEFVLKALRPALPPRL